MDPTDTQVTRPDVVAVDTPALSLPITDDVILTVMNDAEMRAKAERDKLDITKRSEENRKFWLGQHVDESKLDKRYQMAHVDNVVHQNLENQIKLASGKMPDIFCAPPDDEEYNMEASRDMQQWLRERIDAATIKRLIKDGLRNMNLDFTAIIKCRWDYSKNDFVFELLESKDVVFSEGAKIPQDGFTIDGTDVIFQYVEEPTAVILAKFKNKRDEIIAEIASVTKKADLPARLKYTECHFRWFDEQGRLAEGICWRYGNLILDKMKNPYFDYQNPKINYFDRPRKPYILFSYMNIGTGIYESTTGFEQGIPLNRIINKRRRQITEISDRAVPKLAFSGKAIDKENARNISSSPNEGILLNDTIDDIRKGMFIIPATPPNQMLFNDMQDLRGRVDSVFATHGTARGEGGSESGISKQISREGDLVTSDDLSDVVVERVVTEMANWAMQYARLFYDDDRPAMRTTSEEGDTKFYELNRKKIETDVQVVIKGSTNDKATRRADAIQMLDGKVTDPYTMFEDLDVQNPKERTKRLLSFIQAQQSQDYAKYLSSVGVDMDQDRASEEDAKKDIELIMNGGQPNVENMPTEAYVSTFMAFVNSPEFAQIPPQAQQAIHAHIQKLKQRVQMELTIKGHGEQPPQDPNAAITGAPGVAPEPAAYGPQPDAATVWQQTTGQATNQAPTPTMGALAARIQEPRATTVQPTVSATP